ncbi:MAG: Glycosyl transferase, family 2 [Candidatus Woesebacteria bacterium GW2011_GWB1_38_5b]|uniref:Glycosyl transferase, family 2 n=1 Tax=Candidatus Woesebacteria bacterium GW2011_GWB1_38_5b TaxID=1618569 RepID=A0A0G0KK76_9BACT|nr:MAG: Glycosyl transferase, family 2 [Candidatus Woesebacteria bacterium GW2011_GWB1_38_5b]
MPNTHIWCWEGYIFNIIGMSRRYTPSISVVMPVYNAVKYLRLAIKSILDQTFADFEFIIVDDGSNDGSWEIIKKIAKTDKRIIPLRNRTNLKICKTLNRGIELARGKYVARMDADDWCYPYRLKMQYEFMEKNPEVVICGGAMEVCDTHLKTLGVRKYCLTDSEIRNKIFLYSPFCHATTMYRTYLAKKEKYNEYLYDSEDYDLYFRFGLNGKFANLPNLFYKMRINELGVSLLRSKRQEQLVLLIRLKAVLEYHYHMRLLDKIYLLGQFLSIFAIPPKLKFFLYNLLRNSWSNEINISNVATSPLVPFWGPISYFRVYLLKNFGKNK